MPGFDKYPPGSAYAWWKLNSVKKKVLQQKRLGSDYGGETAAGIGAAPYFWSQEFGNKKAAIKAKRWARDSWKAFRSKAPIIVKEALRETMGK